MRRDDSIFILILTLVLFVLFYDAYTQGNRKQEEYQKEYSRLFYENLEKSWQDDESKKVWKKRIEELGFISEN